MARGRTHPGDDDVPLSSGPGSSRSWKRLHEEGVRAWPGIRLPLAAFAAHAAERTRSRVGSPEGSPALNGADLYLASACALRMPVALGAFEKNYMARVRSYIARMQPSAELVDEVRQSMREKLFVGRDGAPGRIADYDGRGALASWVRVVAVRTALDVGRKRGHVAEAPESRTERAGPASSRRDPEVDYIKRGYRRAFDEAFRTAISRLDADQRKLLHGHFVEGRTLDELARDLGVHRSTVARRIATGRDAVAQEARRLLGETLGANQSEIDSIVALMRSRLDVSLVEVLRAG